MRLWKCWISMRKEGAEEKADTLTEALDALEDAYDVINDVVMDEI